MIPAHLLTSLPLLESLRKMAAYFSRVFPRHLLDYDDFLQEGWVGILSVPQESSTLALCLAAARREMIDAMRRFRPAAHRGYRQVERLAESEEIENLQTPPSLYETYHDLAALMDQCLPREQSLLQALLHEHTLRQIGQQFGVTEGRACQLKYRVFTTLQRRHQRETQYQEAA